MKPSFETTSETAITLKLTGEDITKLVTKFFEEDFQKLGALEKSRVYFNVPSGGDYSGTTLDINSDDAVEVILTYKK